MDRGARKEQGLGRSTAAWRRRRRRRWCHPLLRVASSLQPCPLQALSAQPVAASAHPAHEWLAEMAGRGREAKGVLKSRG